MNRIQKLIGNAFLELQCHLQSIYPKQIIADFHLMYNYFRHTVSNTLLF